MSGRRGGEGGPGSGGRGLLSVNPPELAPPSGFSHGILAPPGGRLLFVAGQVGWDGRGRLAAPDFTGQFEAALRNVVAVVMAAGGAPRDVARLTIYVLDRREYLGSLKEIGAAYRRVMGRHYPAMALVEVRGLVEEGARVEIEGTAVLREG